VAGDGFCAFPNLVWRFAAALGGRPADESGQPSLLLLALVAVLVAGLLVLFVFG
jgi:hypothetical protein